MTKFKEKFMHGVFLFCACVSILAVLLICVFLFANGIPAMKEIGLFDFLMGRQWKPNNNIYGILKYICYCRSHFIRRSDRHSCSRFHDEVLSEMAV